MASNEESRWEEPRSSVDKVDLVPALLALAHDQQAITALHVRMEDLLVEMRDHGIMAGGPRGVARNGLAIFSRDSQPSSVIRMGTREVIQRVLEDAAEYVQNPRALNQRVEELRREMTR